MRASWPLAAGVMLMLLQTGSAMAQPSGQTLLAAARRGDVVQVRQLLGEGVDVNYKDSFGITALWQATSKGHREVVRALVAAGADVNAHDAVWYGTPLMMSTDPELIGLFLKQGARGGTAKLNQAALYGQTAVAEAIVKHRALQPSELRRAREQARMGGHNAIVELLEETADHTLPPVAVVPRAVLETYPGKYLSDRLNEIEVIHDAGKLFVKYETSPRLQVLPIDETTFERGASRYRFHVDAGRVSELVQDDVFSERRYRPGEFERARDGVPPPAESPAEDSRYLAQSRWPGFRGPGARGIAVGQDLPDAWDAGTQQGVRWEIEVPGLGNSSPIVWDEKIFLTTAVSEAGNRDLRIGLYGDGDAVPDESTHSWRLYCFEKDTGRVLWHRVAQEGVPPVKRHLKSSQANSTPATDGQHVVALFASGGLFCYDLAGQLLWSRDLGTLDSGAFNDPDDQWGFGSSPTIYHDRVIVQCDRQTNSFLAAYDLRRGHELWRVERDEVPSWGTPNVVNTARGPIVLTNASNYARGYDALTGKELWRISGNAAITVPTPFIAHDLIFVTSGYRPVQPIFAIQLDAVGDISLERGRDTNRFVSWSKPRGGPYLPTPLVYGGCLYTCSNNGILTCYEATSGKRLYRERIAGAEARSFTASPIAVDGRLYLTAESGTVLVVAAGPKFELLSSHSLGSYCLSTPAAAGQQLLFRTQEGMIAIGK